MFNKIIKCSLYSLVFLLPIFFLPFSFEGYEFNKQYLLFFLVSLAFLTWLARMIICEKEIRFRRTPLDIPILIFMFFSILSAVFSIDKISSFLGFYGRFSDNLVGILSLGALYFLITNNVKPLKDADQNAEKTLKSATNQRSNQRQISVSGLIKTLLWSVFFVLLFSYFSLFGVWQILSKFAAGFQLLGRIFNPIGGGLESLAMFLTVAVVLLVGLLLKSEEDKKGKFGKVVLGFLVLLITVLLIIIDFTAAWVVLGISLILFLVFAFWSRIFRERVNLLLIPIILIIISAAFSFLRVANFNLPVAGFNVLDSPKEILLDQRTTWKVAFGAVKNYPILGSGIGTFSHDFAKFKPESFNQTNFWQLRFDKGASQVAEIISTMGILGFLSWLAVIGLFLMMSYYLLKKIKKGEISYQLPLIFGFLALLISQFVYYQNTTLAFLFWLILGMGVISWQIPLKEKSLSFKDFPEMSLVFNIVLIVIFLATLGSWFFGARFYLADLKYKEGIALNKVENLEKAVKYNQSRANYWIALSGGYFIEASNELQKSPESQDVQKIQLNFAKTINGARIASQISPNWVVGFENLGMIYRDLRGFAQGASSWAVDSFSKAIKLEPTNPVFYTEIGKLLRDDKKTDEAKKEFEKAIQLKSDYLDAKIQMALIFEQEENFQEAINRLKNIVAENPQSVEALFQLGRIYYNNNQTDEAVSQFQQVIQFFPNHSNSLYALGMAYQKKGQKDEAIKIFEKVLELNPGNQDVINKIDELKKPASTPVPTSTPEENK